MYGDSDDEANRPDQSTHPRFHRDVIRRIDRVEYRRDASHDGEADSDIVLEDVMSLMSGSGTEEDGDATTGDEMEEFII